VVRFTGTSGGFVLTVSWNTDPQANALAAWRQLAATDRATDPSYQQISIRRVSYRGYNAAEWQFTNIPEGIRVRVIDRGFIVKPRLLAYAIDLSGPASPARQWRAVYANIWQRLVTSFQPGS